MTQRALVLTVIVVILLGGGYLAYLQLVPPVDGSDGPIYATAPVVRGDISVGVHTRGSLEPSGGGGIQVPGGYGPYGPLPGPSSYIVEEVLVKEGDSVTQGQLLVRLNRSELEGQIEAKEEKLSLDRDSLARMLGVTPDKLDSVDAGRGITLRSPIDGRVVGFSVREGQQLQQGQIVARVVDDSRIRVIAKLTTGEFQNIAVGDKVLLKFSQFDGFTEGQVVDVNPDPVPEATANLHDVWGQYTSDSQGYVFVYWVTIEGKNGGLIQPGMLAQVGIEREAPGSASQPAGTMGGVEFFRYYAEVEGYAHEEQVLSGANAIVTRVYVHEMQRVKTGDALVSLTGEDAQRMVNSMIEGVRIQERELEQLYDLLEKLDVRAQIDGLCGAVYAQPGQTLQAGEWMGHIFNTSDMRMWVEVDDIDVLLVQQGAPVQVTVAAIPDKVFEGVVEYVGMMGKDESGITRYQVNMRVTGSPELRPGMQANAYIDSGSASGVLLVPLEAVFEEDGRTMVEILEDGVPRVVAVEVGLMNDRVAEIRGGLEEGQLVITGSTADLLPSQRIDSDGFFPGGNGGNGGDGDGDGDGGGDEGGGDGGK